MWVDRSFESMSIHSRALLDVFNRISKQLQALAFPAVKTRTVRLMVIPSVGWMEPSRIDGFRVRHKTEHQPG